MQMVDNTPAGFADRPGLKIPPKQGRAIMFWYTFTTFCLGISTKMSGILLCHLRLHSLLFVGDKQSQAAVIEKSLYVAAVTFCMLLSHVFSTSVPVEVGVTPNIMFLATRHYVFVLFCEWLNQGTKCCTLVQT